MRLIASSEFAARLASSGTDAKPASSELLLHGRPTGLLVTGAVLEGAVEWQGYRIAFFTNDVPFEDMLHIYMFSAGMALIDAAVLGAMYSTGTFAGLRMRQPNVLTFRFFGDTAWRLVLLAKREFALPFVSDPAGVTRQFKFSRHFRIEGEPHTG